MARARHIRMAHAVAAGGGMIPPFDAFTVHDMPMITTASGLQYEDTTTGAGPEALLLCKDKALTKKLLSFHKIKVAGFRVSSKAHPLRRQLDERHHRGLGGLEEGLLLRWGLPQLDQAMQLQQELLGE